MTASITKDPNRQETHFAYVDFDYTGIDSTNFTPAIELPAGSVVTGGALIVKTGFGSINATVGDANSNARYLGATSTAAAGRTPLAPTGYTNAQTQNLGIKFASAPSAGTGRLEVSYYIESRATSTQG